MSALPSRSRSLPAALALTIATGVCASAVAQTPKPPPPTLYSCVDEQGRTHTSDRPVAECERRAMRELRSDGLLKREIPAPLTPEQIRAREAQAERDRMIEREKRLAEARDRALLVAYPTLDALESVRRRQLAEIDLEIAQAQRRMVEMHAGLKLAQQQLAEAGRKPEAGSLRLKVAEIANAILVEDAFAKERVHEQARVNARFDADARRLKELLAARGLSPGAASSAPSALSPRASAAAAR